MKINLGNRRAESIFFFVFLRFAIRDIHHQNLIGNVVVIVGARRARPKALRLLINRRY